MKPQSIAFRRLSAFAIDWLVLAIWGTAIFGITYFLYGGIPPRPGPWQLQFISAMMMTVPFIIYFSAFEASRKKATLGKRLVGLCVVNGAGEGLTFPQSLKRNVIKFVPWEFGHMVAHHAPISPDGIPFWLWAAMILGIGGGLWWAISLFLAEETPYNKWADCKVIRVE